MVAGSLADVTMNRHDDGGRGRQVCGGGAGGGFESEVLVILLLSFILEE